jgi:hypothetical protein
MIKNVFDGDADMIVSSISMQPERLGPLKFLPRIASERSALFIRNSQVEIFTYGLFTQLFTLDVWLIAFLMALMVSLLLQILHSIVIDPTRHNPHKSTYSQMIKRFTKGYLGYFWIAFSSNFGCHNVSKLSQPNATASFKVIHVHSIGGPGWGGYS